jgi:acetyl-CoA carboxylase carboxyl transferase subunit beta
MTQDVNSSTQREGIPEGLWLRCPECGDMLFRKVVDEALHVCPKCQYHFRIGARVRVEQLCDPGTFEERFAEVRPTDPLGFADKKRYADRLAAEQKKTGNPDAVVCGKGFIKGRPIMMAVMDPTFMMGSMGSVVGEKITRTIEAAVDEKLPMLIVSCSGGARMQESALSLMQMAKTSAALARLDDAGGLFISLLADPTTGGVTASFAMLGDFIVAEPKALIGFAGPRTIWKSSCPRASSAASSSRIRGSSTSSSTAKTCAARSPGWSTSATTKIAPPAAAEPNDWRGRIAVSWHGAMPTAVR